MSGPENGRPTFRENVNSATTSMGIGVGLMDRMFGRAVPMYATAARVSPLRHANAIANLATTDVNSGAGQVQAAAAGYSMLGFFGTRGLLRATPYVGTALLVSDVAGAAAPVVMRMIDAQAEAGSPMAQQAQRQVRELTQRVEAAGNSASQRYRAYQVAERLQPYGSNGPDW